LPSLLFPLLLALGVLKLRLEIHIQPPAPFSQIILDDLLLMMIVKKRERMNVAMSVSPLA
jgi:hypothetical protein